MIHWRIYAALGGDGFNKTNTEANMEFICLQALGLKPQSGKMFYLEVSRNQAAI